jgi:hypothetical protein
VLALTTTLGIPAASLLAPTETAGKLPSAIAAASIMRLFIIETSPSNRQVYTFGYLRMCAMIQLKSILRQTERVYCVMELS